MFIKVFGWFLLLAGLAVIVYSLYSSYNIFFAKKPVPEIFTLEEGPLPSQTKEAQGLEGQMEELIQNQLKGMLGQMLPSDSITKLLNLISWSIFASILIFGGGKISGLGIRLIKNKT